MKQNIVLPVFSCLSFMGRVYFQALLYKWRVYTFWKNESRGISMSCTIRKVPNNTNIMVESWELDMLLHKTFILIDSKAHLKWIKLLTTNVQVRGEKKAANNNFFSIVLISHTSRWKQRDMLVHSVFAVHIAPHYQSWVTVTMYWQISCLLFHPSLHATLALLSSVNVLLK